MTNFCIFCKGVITGAGIMLALVLVIAAFYFFNERDRKMIETLEAQNEVQDLYEKYSSRDPVEFLDTSPGVRGAADRARDEYHRRVNELLQRYGSPGLD